MGVGVSDGDDGMTAIQVQVLLSLVIPYLTSLSFYDVNVEKGIHVE
jgi:hypothetical protein